MAVSLVENLLTERGIDYLSVSGRTKSLLSATDKIKRKNYSNPVEQLTDLSGIRVVTYFESQVQDVCSILRQAFNVDEANSLDRDAILGHDKIGYRSTHLVCQLGENREVLAEYAGLSRLKFEFQVRTVLQHAWAELAHDRAYKFSVVLPSALQRKLNLYSGLLELVDQGFDEISRGIDQYKDEVASVKKPTEIASLEIDSISLEGYLAGLFAKNELQIESMPIDEEVIRELRTFGFSKVGDIDKYVTEHFLNGQKELYASSKNTNVGFLRDVMMFVDMHKYFDKCWKISRWRGCDPESVKFLELKYDRDEILRVMDAHEIRVDVDY